MTSARSDGHDGVRRNGLGAVAIPAADADDQSATSGIPAVGLVPGAWTSVVSGLLACGQGHREQMGPARDQALLVSFASENVSAAPVAPAIGFPKRDSGTEVREEPSRYPNGCICSFPH